jgi:hypothetical protein
MAKAIFEKQPEDGWVPAPPEEQLPGFNPEKHRATHLISRMLERDIRENTPLPSRIAHLKGDLSHDKQNDAIEGLGKNSKDLFFDNSPRNLFSGGRGIKLNLSLDENGINIKGIHAPSTPENETMSDRLLRMGNSVLSSRQHLDTLKNGATTGALASATAKEFEPGGVLDKADKGLKGQGHKLNLLMGLAEDYVPEKLVYKVSPNPDDWDISDDEDPEEYKKSHEGRTWFGNKGWI